MKSISKNSKGGIITVKKILLFSFFVLLISGAFGLESRAEGFEFADFTGTWRMQNGTGTAVNGGTTYQLKLVPSDVTVSVENISGDDSEAIVSYSHDIVWQVFDNGNLIRTEPLDTYGRRTYKRLGENTFQNVRSDIRGWLITVTMNSATAGTVTETGIYLISGIEYNVNATYSMVKENTDPVDEGDSGGGCNVGIGFAGMFALAMGLIATRKKNINK
jgi:hypothetical protein